MIGWAGFFSSRRADERELLDPRDIIWVGAMQITTGIFFLVEFDQHLLPAAFADQVIVFRRGSVAPEDVLRLREGLDLVHPIENGLVGRLVVTHASGRRNGRSDVFHGFAARDKRTNL